MRWWFGCFRTCCLLLGLLLLVVSFTPVVSWGAKELPVDWYQGDADVLVVLGGAMLVDGTGPKATLGYESYLRCTYASWNLMQHHYRYVILSGSDGLAETMAAYLIAHGANRSQLLVESAARTTFQNAQFVKNILDHEAGLPAHPTIAILTSDYHTRRAQMVFRRMGIAVHAIPVPDALKRSQSIRQRWNAFLDIDLELLKFGYYKVLGRI